MSSLSCHGKNWVEIIDKVFEFHSHVISCVSTRTRTSHTRRSNFDLDILSISKWLIWRYVFSYTSLKFSNFKNFFIYNAFWKGVKYWIFLKTCLLQMKFFNWRNLQKVGYVVVRFTIISVSDFHLLSNDYFRNG